MEKGKDDTESTYEVNPKEGEIAESEFIDIIKNSAPDVTLLDVRLQEEVETGFIPGSLLIPADKLLERISEIPSNEDIIIYCRSGLRAEMVYSLLKDRGYSVKYLSRTLDIKKDGSFAIID